MHDPFRRLRLACPRLARDNDALILLVALHVVIRRLSRRKDMRGHLKSILALVGVEDRIRIDAQIAKGIHRDQHMADISVDFCSFEALLQIIVDRLVRNLADERKVRNSDFLLLRALELGFLNIRPSPTALGLRRALVLLATCALCDRLSLCELA